MDVNIRNMFHFVPIMSHIILEPFELMNSTKMNHNDMLIDKKV